MPRKPPNDTQLDSNTKAMKHLAKTPSDSGLGRALYGDKENAAELALPLDKQGKMTRETWGQTAYILALRAKKASQTYGKKDFNSLYRLVLSAGIAYDKAWPVVQNVLTGNLVVQLFGSLSNEAASKILEPPHPVITVESIPAVVSHEELPVGEHSMEKASGKT